MKIKSSKQMERHLKGIANHYRIDILFVVANNDGITLEGLVDTINANEKTLGEHTRRLVISGLINKKYRGRYVEHRLSPYGKTVVRFLKQFRRIS